MVSEACVTRPLVRDWMGRGGGAKFKEMEKFKFKEGVGRYLLELLLRPFSGNDICTG